MGIIGQKLLVWIMKIFCIGLCSSVMAMILKGLRLAWLLMAIYEKGFNNKTKVPKIIYECNT